MYWILNKLSKKPKFFNSMKNLSEYTSIKYHVLAHQFSRNQEVQFENEIFLVNKCETIEEAMIGFANTVNEKVEFQYIGDYKQTIDEEEVILKVYQANKFERRNEN